MLAYFPQIHAGELLYSVVARYLRHQGSMGQTAALASLFGRRLVVASLDLPGHLDVLSQRIPSERGWNVDRLIDETTLYSYYTAFQPPAVCISVRDAMRSGAVADLHLRLGLPAYRTARVSRLRFCCECLVQMQALHGEAYWRREHQLPGALLCIDHESILRPSDVDLAGIGRHQFVAATRANCPTTAPCVVESMPPSVHALLLRVTRASVALLTQTPPPRSFAEWTAFYRELMQRAGLASTPRRMDQEGLADAFRRHVGDGQHHLPGAVGASAESAGWLSSLVRKQRKATHPLMHVLLQDVLATRFSPEPPFGAGPWPCLNPLVRHRLAKPIETVTLHRNRGRVVGVFRCRCGYAYTRNYDPATGISGTPRFLAFGPRLSQTLKRWLAAGLALREVGRRLALDPRTVVRLATELGLSTPWTWSARPRTRTATPALDPAGTAPGSGLGREARASAGARRDWSAIDRACVHEIGRFVAAIRCLDPPLRVTRAEVERRAHRRDWLLHRRGKLPLANACLQRLVESVSDFQLRRIHWAIGVLCEERGAVKAWHVMRKAGLRSAELPRIQAVLEMPRPARQSVA